MAILLVSMGLDPDVSSGQSSSAVQQVSVGVAPIVVMAVFGEPRPFILDGMTTQNSISDLSSYYNLTTNLDGVMISAEIDAPMPAGTSLFLSGESMLGTSRGLIDISRATSSRQIISSIDHGLENGRRFHYEFRVDDGIDEIPLQSRTVTLSLLDPSSRVISQMAQTVFFGASR